MTTSRRRLAGTRATLGAAAAVAALLSAAGCGSDHHDDGPVYDQGVFGQTALVCAGPGGVRVDDGLCGYPHPGYGQYVYQVHPGGVLVPNVGQAVPFGAGRFTTAPPRTSAAYRSLGKVYTPTPQAPRVSSGPSSSSTITRGGFGSPTARTSSSSSSGSSSSSAGS